MMAPPRVPKLLVSVRNADEAQTALAGGADIIDVKEPRRGSLGMADCADIQSVVAIVQERFPALPISTALGELVDWRSSRSLPTVPDGVQYLKLGLSKSAGFATWREDWLSLRKRLDERCGRRFQWVAVVYADWQVAAAPRPQEILAAARETDCAGILLDTFRKDGGSLAKFATVLEEFSASLAADRLDLPLAVAGGLRARDLPLLGTLRPGIVAIRSAACRDGVREGEICETAVRNFREEMQRAIPSRPRPFAG